MTQEESLNKALQVKVAAEALLLAFSAFENTPLFKGATKQFATNCAKHFDGLTKSFMEHANEDEKRQHSQAAWMVYEKIKETNIKLKNVKNENN
jgi:hypothetical protein